MKERIIWIGALFIILGYLCYTLYGMFFKTSDDEIIVVEVRERILDIGKVKKSDESIAVFEITNIGSKDILIDTIVSDCHCTVAKWNRNPIGYEKTFNVRLTFDNNQEGFFEQKAKVFFKNSKSPPELLIMRGTVVE